jgi:WD40 repeat protein
MSTSLRRLDVLAPLALLWLALPQKAPAAAPPGPTPVDRHGDPLPRGAVARLGTLRFFHLGDLTSVAVSPDGKVVASGVREGKDVYLGEKVLFKHGGFTLGTGERLTLATVRLWDAATGKVLREIITPDAPVSCLRFGPDGRTLFAGCGRFLCAWDTATGKKLWQQEGVPGGRFHYGVRAERLMVAGGKLVSLHGGTLMCPVTKAESWSIHYHPQVVVRLWDRKTGRPLPTPSALQSTVHAEVRITTLFHDAAVSTDGRLAAVRASRADPLPREEGGGDDRWKYTARRLLLVDLATGKVVHTIPDGKDAVSRRNSSPFDEVVSDTLAFSDEGGTLAVAAENNIALVQTTDGRQRLLVKGATEGLRLAFVGAGKQLAARQRYRDKVHVWDVATGKPVEVRPAHANAFAGSHNGRVAAAAHGNTVRLTDLRSGKDMHPFEGHRLTPLVRFALHSANTLLSADGEGACLWEPGAWRQKGALTLPGGRSGYWFAQESMDQGASWAKGLYVKERDKRLELREIKTDRPLRALEGADPKAWAYFSANGERLVSHAGNTFRFFDIATGKALSKVARSEVMWLRHNTPELSPRGTFFAKNDKGDRVELYEVASGKVLRALVPSPAVFPARGRSVLRFHFSADEQVLFGEVHHQLKFETGFSEERVNVTLWDIATGAILQEMVVSPRTFSFWRQALGESKVGALALSHDRRFLALARTGGKDVEIWETASGTRRGVLAGHVGPVVSLSFSPDGKYLASGSEDTTVLVWNLRRPLHPTALKASLNEAELAGHWKALLQPDAEKGDRAVWSLVSAPRDAIPFLKKRLRPAPRPDAERLKRLFADLDSADFTKRSAAAAEVEAFGELAIGALEKAVRLKNGLEKQRRLESLLSAARQAARPFGAGDRVRQLRALEVLERAAKPEAVELLRGLAGGDPGARITGDARAALARLRREANPGR